MKSIFEQSGGTYTKVGDYYFPNISLPDTSKYQIGKYGNLRCLFFMFNFHSICYQCLYVLSLIEL